MTPDYAAFRRVADKMIDAENPMSAAIIEREEGNLYLLSEQRYLDLLAKAEAYDRLHPPAQGQDDADEEAALRALIAGNQNT